MSISEILKCDYSDYKSYWKELCRDVMFALQYFELKPRNQLVFFFLFLLLNLALV